VDGDRDVVREQRQVHARAQGAEVARDLLGVGARVEGRGGDQGVGAELGGHARVGDDARGRRVDDTGEHGDPARRRLHDGPQGDGTLLVGQIRDLAGRAEGEQSVHAARDEVLDETGEGGGVHLTRLVEGGADGRDDPAQGCGQGHGGAPGSLRFRGGRASDIRRPTSCVTLSRTLRGRSRGRGHIPAPVTVGARTRTPARRAFFDAWTALISAEVPAEASDVRCPYERKDSRRQMSSFVEGP
jgi:hypothetical protein